MITYIIIGITCFISISAFNNSALFHKFLFNPYLIHNNKRDWYRFFTHAFIHADWMHLLLNMMVLYFFGYNLERYSFIYLFGIEMGALNYILLYLGGILFSSLPSYAKYKNSSYYSSVGASGAVSAVVFSGILIDPLQKIYFMFIPFAIPGVIFGAFYLWYSWYMAKKGQDNIGHDAHFWGAVFGIGFTLLIEPRLAISFFEQITALIP